MDFQEKRIEAEAEEELSVLWLLANFKSPDTLSVLRFKIFARLDLAHYKHELGRPYIGSNWFCS